MVGVGEQHDDENRRERDEHEPTITHHTMASATRPVRVSDPQALPRPAAYPRWRGAPSIAKQCGAGVEMLERSYSFAIEDLEDEGPKPAEAERLNARQLAVAGSTRQLRVA